MSQTKTFVVYNNYELLDWMNRDGIEAVIMGQIDPVQIEDVRLRQLAEQLRGTVSAIDAFLTDVQATLPAQPVYA